MTETSEPTPEQTALAGQLVDLANTAWSLRARVADTRGVSLSFGLGEAAFEALTTHENLDAGFGPLVTYHEYAFGVRVALFCGLAFSIDPACADWQVQLVVAPEPT